MFSHTHDQNQHSFFNFSSILKSCGCMARDGADKSQSSNMSARRLNPQNEGGLGEVENNSSFSNAEWVDLEELPPNIDSHLNQNYNGDYDITTARFNLEDYETLEPIDFDSLKELTGEDDDENKSQSRLSKSSRKINKDKAASLKNTSANTPKKGAKARGKRNPWQPHEDGRLLELVNKHGQSWSLIASLMEGRTGKQIRDRYLNILRPNIKKGDWTHQEDQQILALYYEFGHKWSKIASYVPERTEGQVKNRFYAHIKKKILNGDDSIDPNFNKMHNKPLRNGISELKQIESIDVKHEYGSTPKTLSTATHSNISQIRFGQIHGQTNDPVDAMISYSDENKVSRTGTGEKFINQESASSPNSQYSGITASTAYNSVKNEREINDILQKVVHDYEKEHSSPNQEDLLDNFIGNTVEDPNAGQIERVEQLQKRRQALEFLLHKTMQEMNHFNVNN